MIVYHSPFPSVDSIVHELIAGETCIKSHADEELKATSIPTSTLDVLDVSSNQSLQTSKVAYHECAFCK